MGRPRSSDDAKVFAKEMRNDMPMSERAAWSELKGEQLGVRFRRQGPIGPYVVDFCCLSKRLVIEIDGPSHDWTDETERTRYIEAAGFEILRIDNEDVARYGVTNTVQAWLETH